MRAKVVIFGKKQNMGKTISMANVKNFCYDSEIYYICSSFH